jgi:hypothetical protein
MLPFIILFKKSFNEIEKISKLNNLTIILIILCLIFIVSFFIFLFFGKEFEFNERLGGREYEPEDLNRFKRNLKKALIVYSISLLIWIIAFLIVIFEFGKVVNIWKVIYLLTFPMIFIVIMIYFYNRLKTTYNNL